MLLGDPEAALIMYFPVEARNPWERPAGLAEEYNGAVHRRVAWQNHCYGVWVLVTELHAQATGQPLLPLLLKSLWPPQPQPGPPLSGDADQGVVQGPAEPEAGGVAASSTSSPHLSAFAAFGQRLLAEAEAVSTPAEDHRLKMSQLTSNADDDTAMAAAASPAVSARAGGIYRPPLMEWMGRGPIPPP